MINLQSPNQMVYTNTYFYYPVKNQQIDVSTSGLIVKEEHVLIVWNCYQIKFVSKPLQLAIRLQLERQYILLF